MKVVALCRMSVAYDDFGNQRQEAEVRAHAERRGHEIVAVKHDVMSATKFRLNDRPGWVEGLAMVQAGHADAVGIYHIDRLTRDNRDLEDVIDTGVPVLCAAGEIDLSTDSGRTMARILVAIAKGEVERKSARQKLANQQRFERGLPFAGGPRAFCYTPDGMEIVEAEVEGFRWAVAQALAGVSLRSIAAGLVGRGLVSSRACYTNSGGWTHGGIKKLLTNPRYCGLRTKDGEEIKGVWPTVIDVETHLALKRLLGDPDRDPTPGRVKRNPRKAENLASLIAQCAVCEQPLIAGRGGANPTYTCRSGHGCVYPPRGPLDEAMADHLLALMSQPGFVETLTPRSDARVKAAQAQIDKLQRRLSVVNDDNADGVYDDDHEEYQRTTRDLRGRIKEQKTIIAELEEHQLYEGLSLGTEQVIGQWETVPLERQRLIASRLLEYRVRPTGPRRAWDAEQHLIVKRRRHVSAV